MTARSAPAPHPRTEARSGQLAASHLSLAYGTRPVLNDVSLHLARGWTAIVGPNGAGKSSLLRVLAGLLPPQKGQVTLDGQALHGAQAMAVRQRAQRLAWLAQSGEVSGELTLRETVALGRLPHLGLLAPYGPADHDAIEQALLATACQTLQHRRLAELSGGERQRALLARALATGADVLLLDEPTTHLDPPHQVALARLTRQLAASRSVITVVHDLALALAADRIVLLDAGQVRAHGAAADPAVHDAICASFGGAIRILWNHGQGHVIPQW